MHMSRSSQLLAAEGRFCMSKLAKLLTAPCAELRSPLIMALEDVGVQSDHRSLFPNFKISEDATPHMSQQLSRPYLVVALLALCSLPFCH